MDIAISVNKIPIRLTVERWQHISTGHPEISDFYYEILETIENPAIIYKGSFEELIAISNELSNSGKFIIVIYKEESNLDGFIITAYITNKIQRFVKKKIVWKNPL